MEKAKRILRISMPSAFSTEYDRGNVAKTEKISFKCVLVKGSDENDPRCKACDFNINTHSCHAYSWGSFPSMMDGDVCVYNNPKKLSS